MRVAIVLKTFPPDVIGGMETQTQQLATELTEAGNEVTVFTKRFGVPDDGEVPYEIVRVRNYQLTPFISDLTFLVFALIAVIRRRAEIDVLQCMMIYPVGFLGYVINKLTCLPYFAWIRGGDYYLMREVWWKRWMMRKVLENTLVLAQSNEIRDDVIGDFDDVECDIEILGNAVSIPNETSTGDGVLFIGRLVPKKGIKYLIRAMDNIDSTLTIVGDGPERSKLEGIAEQVDAKIFFIGEVHPDQVREYYRQAGVFVLPSIEGEGMPNAVLEAMSWGLPVVATDSGGLRSMIQHESTGYIVPMRDPDAIAEKVSHLLENLTKRQRMGLQARNYVEENHSWEVIIDELEAVYRNIRDKKVLRENE